MTDSKVLLELAARVEAVVWEQCDPGYPQRLGIAINEALGIASYITDDGNPVLSLDAAIKLLPQGWAIDRLAMWPSDSPISCCANLVGIIEPTGFYRNSEVKKVGAHGCSMPLALTAACLRARAAEGAQS